METEVKPKNIYQRLAEVRKTVSYLKKDNDSFQYKYVSSSQTLGNLSAKINEMGLILIPEIISQEITEHKNSKGNTEFFTKLNMNFIWVNIDEPTDRVVCHWTAQGIDNAEKGIGKALTYAEKYFMLKFFNIATDKDDPDKFQEKFETKEEKAERERTEKEAEKIKKEQEAKQAAEEKAKQDAENKRIQEVITSVNNAKNADDLKIIRVANPGLENTNSDYKKALSLKYKSFDSENLMSQATKEAQPV